MKISAALGTAAILLMFGTTCSLCAQDQKPPDQQEEAKPPKPAQDDKPTAKPPQDEKPSKPDPDAKPTKPVDQPKPSKDDKKDNPPKQDKQTASTSPAHTAQTNQRGHIPDDKYKAHFGSGHHFKIGHPTIVGGAPRFQYQGFWFQLTDPWPTGWAYTDEVYIIYVGDGYYLCDPLYPGVQVAIIVVV
jgi:hypothetical protein